jgi:hypothetical protein
MPSLPDRATMLRHEADALLVRASREAAGPCREAMLYWAQKMNDSADKLEMAAARGATKH